MESLVSVVIIFLDSEPFIQEAIESVFAQTYSAWELLLVDDGSNDRSAVIARRYAEHCSGKVHYLEHEGRENRGMSASRNLGIRHAKGEFIAFLDADDVWFPQTLEQQVITLKSQPEAGMVYGPMQYWYSWTGNPQDRECDYIEPLGVPANTVIKPPRLLPLFLQDKAAVPSGIMIRRGVIEHVGGFEEVFRGEYEDQAFRAKVCLNIPVFASGQCWYRYRRHPDSSVSIGQKTGQTYYARLFFLNWLTAYLIEQKVKDRRVWRALQRELWPYRRPRLFRWLQCWQAWSRWLADLLSFALSGRSMVKR